MMPFSRPGFLRWMLLAPLVVWMALWGAGCASLGSYSVGEAELERALMRQVEAFDRDQLRMGSPLSVALKAVDIELGPNDRDVVVLDLDGQIALNALMVNLPLDIGLKLEGAPVYSSQDKAVYLRRLKLLDSRIESPYFGGDLKPVAETAMRLVSQMLETMPVYRLDESDFWQRRLASVPMDIRVARGRLIFEPAGE